MVRADTNHCRGFVTKHQKGNPTSEIFLFFLEYNLYFLCMHSIQTIVFDFGGVILDLKPEIEWFQQDMLAHFENDKLLKLYQQQYFQKF
jgi:hypothetical protein